MVEIEPAVQDDSYKDYPGSVRWFRRKVLNGSQRVSREDLGIRPGLLCPTPDERAPSVNIVLSAR
jgi:hypothetical protein